MESKFGQCWRCNANLNETTKCPLCGAFNHTDATFARMEAENRAASGQSEPVVLRETISAAPVRLTVYHRGQRMLNDTHRLVMPHGEYAWYVVGEVWMDSADEFFASPFVIFEGTVWKGYTEAEDKRDWLIEQVRMDMRDGISRAKRLASVEPNESAALESRCAFCGTPLDEAAVKVGSLLFCSAACADTDVQRTQELLGALGAPPALIPSYETVSTPDIEADPLPDCFHLSLHYNEKENFVFCSRCGRMFIPFTLVEAERDTLAQQVAAYTAERDRLREDIDALIIENNDVKRELKRLQKFAARVAQVWPRLVGYQKSSLKREFPGLLPE